MNPHESSVSIEYPPHHHTAHGTAYCPLLSAVSFRLKWKKNSRFYWQMQVHVVTDAGERSDRCRWT